MEYDINLGCYLDASHRQQSTLALMCSVNTIVARLDITMLESSINSDIIKLSTGFTFRPSRNCIYVSGPDGNVTIGLHVNTTKDLLSILREKFANHSEAPIS